MGFTWQDPGSYPWDSDSEHANLNPMLWSDLAWNKNNWRNHVRPCFPRDLGQRPHAKMLYIVSNIHLTCVWNPVPGDQTHSFLPLKCLYPSNNQDRVQKSCFGGQPSFDLLGHSWSLEAPLESLSRLGLHFTSASSLWRWISLWSFW